MFNFKSYSKAASVQEAVALLQENSDAKLLAGGQSLMPMLNMRLVEPIQLIDINRLQALSYIQAASSALHLGALSRQYQLEAVPEVAQWCPLLGEAIRPLANRDGDDGRRDRPC